MIDTRVTQLDATMETEVTLELRHITARRADSERYHGAGALVAAAVHRQMFRELIGGEFADDWREEVRQEREAVATLGQELAAVRADRDRLARVVDKLTGA